MININGKQWDKLRSIDILKTISEMEDETFFFELKDDRVTNDRFIKEVSAFANTYGGYIFLGISDSKEIEGCVLWTEQRIHSVMHDSITPIPNFDVKSFKIENKKILVVKIEEGDMPPYITNKGQILERVSSGSFAIKDSAKLALIYNKRETRLHNIEKKITFDKIPINENTPENLCAYLDFGFSMTFSEPTKLFNKFLDFDLQPICNYLNEAKIQHSISRQGTSFIVAIGELLSSKKGIVSGVHNFCEFMLDGSVRGRIVLTFDNNIPNIKVDIYPLLSVTSTFEKIYKLFIDKSHFGSFISAERYEDLTVLKQFTPCLLKQELPEFDIYKRYLNNHIKKYGGLKIISSSRTPATGFRTVDKRFFNDNKIKYTYDNLIGQIFPNYYTILGYIDPLK